MSLLNPFVYPAQPHFRRHAPAGYAEYQAYKPWLRDEFTFRCVYCLQRETWSRGLHTVFSVDHVVPQNKDPNLVCVYSNLVYACLWCNSARQDISVIDPTEVGMAEHLVVEASGLVKGLTEDGRVLVELLHLNAPAAVKERLRIRRICDRGESVEPDEAAITDYKEAFGYPDDLPDLRRLQPPLGNCLAGNCTDCYHARRERKELPTIY
jgi:hypothetical protein